LAATRASIETYLTAAQTAFESGDYQETEKQIILGQIELTKLPVREEFEATRAEYRKTFEELITNVRKFNLKANRGTRRSTWSELANGTS